jgi:hypothetical protein
MRWLPATSSPIRFPVPPFVGAVRFGRGVRAILLVMQPVASHLRYVMRRRWFLHRPFSRSLDSDYGTTAKRPSAPADRQPSRSARRISRKWTGSSPSSLIEVVITERRQKKNSRRLPDRPQPRNRRETPRAKALRLRNFYVVDGSIMPKADLRGEPEA